MSTFSQRIRSHGLLIAASIFVAAIWIVDAKMGALNPPGTTKVVSLTEATERCGGKVPHIVRHEENGGVATMYACPGEYESFPVSE